MKRNPGRHPQQRPPQQPTEAPPMAEIVVRFKKCLVHDNSKRRKKDPTIKVFRQAHMAIQGNTVCINEVGGSQHFFHWEGDDGVESVEAVPGKIEVVAG